MVIDRKILGNITDIGPDLTGLGAYIKTGDFGPAGGGGQKGGEHHDGGGFAGAVGPQKTKNLAFLYMKGNVFHRTHSVGEGL